MTPCYKCGGLVQWQYDVELRCEEMYCVNCGARPEHKPIRADGQAVEATLYCVRCKEVPRTTIYVASKGVLETVHCEGCRVFVLRQKRNADSKRRQKMGNVRYKGALLT